MSDSDSEHEHERKPTRSKKARGSAAPSTKAGAKAATTSAARAKKVIKEEEEAKLGEMFPRTTGLKLRIGAHISSAEGIYNAITNANAIGANAFAFFAKPQRRWTSPPYKPEDVTRFAELAQTHAYDLRTQALPHGSYLINLANLDEEKNEQAYAGFIDELKRCEQLDVGLYNLHPGSALKYDRKSAIAKLAANLNRAIAETSFIKIVLENMAGHGNLIGSTFEDLRDVIALITDKSRVGVCIDTCHSFSAGYDIRTEDSFAEVWKKFDEIVGLRYLSALHLNDSKAPFASNKDLHQNIGLGFLGLETFRILVNTEHVQGLPMILETPKGDSVSTWGTEIKLLEWLIGKSKDDPEFIAKRDELSKQGEAERKVYQGKFDAKTQKDGKKQAKLSFKRKKGDESESDDD
ncbi:xylose isomerase-like protein [Limtongia smithiae]|uniref:xylose isomerase-like protein n=1 Tax=Limtongia smithiae TaxID=1125753 RepID=UPI0034CE3DDF